LAVSASAVQKQHDRPRCIPGPTPWHVNPIAIFGPIYNDATFQEIVIRALRTHCV
jgi:hypothetical protein